MTCGSIMKSDQQPSFFARAFRSRLVKILTASGLLLIAFGIGLTILARHAQPLLRDRIVETLSARFQGPAALADLSVSVGDGLLISGKGLKVYGPRDPDIQREGIQPLIAVDEFRFHTGVMSLLRSPMHVGAVFIKGLELNIPPKEDRVQ